MGNAHSYTVCMCSHTHSLINMRSSRLPFIVHWASSITVGFSARELTNFNTPLCKGKLIQDFICASHLGIQSLPLGILQTLAHHFHLLESRCFPFP